MLRQIITPKEPVITMRIPDDMVGKSVEVIAFEIERVNIDGRVQSSDDSGFNRAAFIQSLEGYRVDLSGFVFNRDDANNYD